MSEKFADYQDLPRAARQTLVRELSQRVLDIVGAHHPEPVLGAEIEAQISEQASFIDTDDGTHVHIGDDVLWYAREQAVQKGGVIAGMRGNQLTYRLPDDPIEAGHVSI